MRDMDDLVRLRLARESDLPLLDRLYGDPEVAGEFGWMGWHPSPWPKRWAQNRLLGDDISTLMVEHGGEPIGFVQWHPRPTSRMSYCWNIGIGLLPNTRGKGYGTTAHRLLVRYLFAHTQAHRIEAETELGNIAEQRALEKAGFTREGVHRQCAWRDGAWRDEVAYGVLRTDPGWRP
jgi:RimJ/RimL family protein N-acetyltransferase